MMGLDLNFMSVCVCMCLSYGTSQIYIYTVTLWPNCEGTEFKGFSSWQMSAAEMWERACISRGKHEKEREMPSEI